LVIESVPIPLIYFCVNLLDFLGVTKEKAF